ncbi:MAG: hypothetical protein ABIA59_09925 [Candidatus Latescibacterota bacterium]
MLSLLSTVKKKDFLADDCSLEIAPRWLLGSEDQKYDKFYHRHMPTQLWDNFTVSIATAPFETELPE